MPIPSQASLYSAAPGFLDGAPSHKPTILIVDDEEAPRLSLQIIFQDQYNILLAETGRRAIALAREHAVDLAIMDIRMAGLNGIQVLEQLKRVDPSVEVIMLTAYETIETARQALRLGACDYLSKPFDLADIRGAVSRGLRLRSVSRKVGQMSDRLVDLGSRLQDATLKEEMARMASEVYAGVLHDINNPLTIIFGYVDLLEKRLSRLSTLHGAQLDNVKDDLAVVAKQVHTCCAISSRYLRFLNPHLSEAPEISANLILSDIQSLVKNHPAAIGSRLEVELLRPDATVLLNGTELLQILLNLSINAFQSTPLKQKVVMAAKFLERAPEPGGSGDHQIWVGGSKLDRTKAYVAISVTDEGGGIQPEHFPKIFDAYFTTKESDRGSGLGLSIVQRLVLNAGGLIHASSKPGSGARFTVYLPARR